MSKQGNARFQMLGRYPNVPNPNPNYSHPVPNNIPHGFLQHHATQQQQMQYNHYPRQQAPTNLQPNQQMQAMQHMHPAVSSHNGNVQMNYQQQRPAMTPGLQPQMMIPFQQPGGHHYQVWQSNVNVQGNHFIPGITYIIPRQLPQSQPINTPTSQHQQSPHQQPPHQQYVPAQQLSYQPQSNNYVSHQPPGPVPTPQPQAQAPKLLPPAPRNKKVIPIIDPKTNRNVLDDLMTHQPPQHQIQQQAPRQSQDGGSMGPQQQADTHQQQPPPPVHLPQHHPPPHPQHHHMEELSRPSYEREEAVNSTIEHQMHLPNMLQHHGHLINHSVQQSAPIRHIPSQILQRPQTQSIHSHSPPPNRPSSTPSPVVQSLVNDNLESLHSQSQVNSIPTVSALSTGPEVDLADLNQKALSSYPNLPSMTSKKQHKSSPVVTQNPVEESSHYVDSNHSPSIGNSVSNETNNPADVTDTGSLHNSSPYNEEVYTLLKRPSPNDSLTPTEVKSSSQSHSPLEEIQTAPDIRLRASVASFHSQVEEGAPPSPPPVETAAPEERTPSPERTPEIEARPSLPTPQCAPVQPKLKHSYQRDQWSPINQDGMKKYSRDFLLKLQSEAMSKPKPANLPDLEIVLKDFSKNSSIAKNISTSHNSMFTPHYAKPVNIRQNTTFKQQQQPLLKTRSIGGKVSKPVLKAPIIACISISLKDDIKLRESENAWRPNNTIDEDDKLYKQVRGVLNKLTPDNFESLKQHFKELPINTTKRLDKVIDIMFQKAIAEPNFSEFYAKMCYEMMKREVVDETKPTNPDGKHPSVNFKNLMINKCQQEFEKSEYEEKTNDSKLKEIKAEPDPEKQKELILIFEEEERLIRKRSVGNCRFIGELYKLNMLTTKIMHHCISKLLEKAEEEPLERACKLLSTIGKDLESHDKDPEIMKGYFNTMEELASKRNSHALSSRVRFMLQDVIDLRRNKWVPRRNENRPKTIQQIAYEAETEKFGMNSMSKKLDLKPLEADRKAAFQAAQKDWKPHTPQYKTNFVIDKTKLMMRESPAELKLGPSNKNIWHQGSNINKPSDHWNNFNPAFNSDIRSNASNKPAPSRKVLLPTPTATENKYSVLHNNNNNVTSSSATHHKSEPISVRSRVHKESNESDKDLTSKKRNFVRIYIEEYLCNSEYTDLIHSVRKQEISNLDFCFFALEIGCQKSSEDYHRKVGSLLSVLYREKAVNLVDISDAMMKFFQNTIDNDLYTDTPHLSKYIAAIIAPLVEENVITFAHVSSTTQCLKTEYHEYYRQTLVKELLKILGFNKAPSWLQSKWNLSKVKLSDFISNSEDRAFEYPYFFVGPMDKANYSTVIKAKRTEQDLMNRIKDVIISYEHNSCDTVNLCVDLVNWTKGNFGSIKDLSSSYYRALTNTLLSCVISKSKEKVNIQEYSNYIHVYKLLELTEDQEIQVLNAVFHLVQSLEFPPGLLLDCFKCLYQGEAVSTSAFNLWSRSDQTDSKGVALKQLTSFYQMLNEVGEGEN